MTPDGDGRHCARCASTVLDLSRITRSQAEAILRERGGEVCGRVRANARGEAVFALEPVRRGLVPVALAGLLAACSAGPSEEPAPETAHAEPPHEVGLAMTTSGSFGGSLATGVMMPVGPDAPLTTPVVPSIQIPRDDEVMPTDEQRALTRRKHQRPPIAYPPPTHVLMGRISSHRP
jgi:hypothetical protein